MPQSSAFMKDFDDNARGNNGLRVVFYNLENFFDSFNDSLKADDEFSAFGSHHWGKEKFNRKLNNIYKVIANIGGMEPPEIIGVCEIENKLVLNELVYGTPLRKFKYKYVQYDSPDPRGIDVALIYRTDKFKVLYSEPFKIVFPFDTISKTRDVLYVKGQTKNNDSLHIFVTHFPSKYGGSATSGLRRNFVAGFIKSKTDSILKLNNKAYIILIGDFNDEPKDESLTTYLKAKCDVTDTIDKYYLYNLMCNMQNKEFIGTNKFREKWSIIDQIIVSDALLNKKGWQIKDKKAYIFKTSYLLEPDEQFLGYKTNRTYQGFLYKGGFSDHLPVYTDLIYVK